VILHGLSTFGFAARAILQAVGAGQPTALRYFGARFTAPVAPGDALETRAWEVKRGKDGTTEVAFEVTNTTTGKVSPEAKFRLTSGFDCLRSFSVADSRELSSPSVPGFETFPVTPNFPHLISCIMYAMRMHPNE
jgi:hypothetical protein